MRYFLLLITMICLTGCWCKNVPMDPHNAWVPKIDADEVTAIVMAYGNEWQFEKDLRLEDAKVFYGDHIHTIQMQFISQGILDVRHARELLVDMVDDFLNKINSDPNLRPYLLYPLTENCLEIYVDFESYYGLYVDWTFVGWMALKNGISYFYAFDIKKFDIIDWWHYRSEYFYKSRQIVAIERAVQARYTQLVAPKELSPISLETKKSNAPLTTKQWVNPVNPNRPTSTTTTSTSTTTGTYPVTLPSLTSTTSSSSTTPTSSTPTTTTPQTTGLYR